MLRSIKSSQRKLRVLALRLEGSTGTLSVEGPDSHQVTVTDNGTGDYTVTLNQAFAAKPIAVGNAEAVDKVVTIVPDKGSISVKVNDIDETPALSDGDVQLIIIGSDVDSKI